MHRKQEDKDVLGVATDNDLLIGSSIDGWKQIIQYISLTKNSIRKKGKPFGDITQVT
jgi:hypothetical protein